MVEQIETEEIWVNVAEGAEKTGFHPDHVRRLARKNRRLPESQRYIRIRKDARRGYAIWLPDLMSYIKKRGNALDNPVLNHETVEEIWVSTGEGAEITGYNRDHLQKLARDNWKLPEEQRLIRGIRKRRWGYDIWLPDLISYLVGPKRGPQPKRK